MDGSAGLSPGSLYCPGRKRGQSIVLTHTHFFTHIPLDEDSIWLLLRDDAFGSFAVLFSLESQYSQLAPTVIFLLYKLLLST